MVLDTHPRRLSMEVHAYAGMAEDSRFHEPLRHNYSHSWKEGETYRAAVCKGELMLTAHDSDDEAETYTLQCHACNKRVLEIEGHSIQHFLDKVSVDPTNDGQMVCRSGFSGYLTPDYLRWCGYPASLLEKVRRDGPKYLWRK